MSLTCYLDRTAARHLLEEIDPQDPYVLARYHLRDGMLSCDDPVTYLALQQALHKLCQDLMTVDFEAEAVTLADFWVQSIEGEEVRIGVSPAGQYCLHRHLLQGVFARLSSNRDALVLDPVEMPLPVSRAGRFIGRFLPYRRKVIEQGMRRVYGERVSPKRLHRLMLAHYSHLATLLWELLVFRFKSVDERASRVRVQGEQRIIEAFEAGKGMLILTGHFGNFEVSTVSGIEHFPLAKGRIHFLRRPIKPKWLSDFLTRRFNRAGFGVIGRRGSLEEIVNRLESGEAIVFPFDQYAHKPDGIDVPLFGVPTGTYKSMAVLAMATGAPVISGSSWREPDGSHVLKFWGQIESVEDEDVGKEISRNTELYNRELERMILYKPEQWWWVHRRWKNAPAV